ncbi:MAG: hypothetical protein ACYC61_06695 [Isosphaeraceae bacterium]
MGTGLAGNYRIRALRSAFEDVRGLCPRIRDQMEIRRHALKLRYWPERHPADEAGKILDLDWEWVRALRGLHVGELRIGDVIGGNNNLRVIFYLGNAGIRDPLPMIWILRVFQKRRDDFSRNDLAIFRARRLLVIERFENPRL